MVKKNPDFRFNRKRKSGKTEFFEVHIERALITHLITALFLIFRIFFSHLRARTAEYYSYATSKSWSPALTNAWLLRKCRTTYIIECIILLTGPRSGHSVLISKIPLLSKWHTNIVQDCKLLSERLSESTCNLSHCSSYLVTRDNPGDALVLKQK